MTTRPGMRRDLLRGVAMAGAMSAVVPRRAAAALPDPGRLRQWLQPLEGGGPRFLMMRHAQTEAGTGDPPGYRLSDCATQRNLSESGRQQARALGDLLQQAQVRFDAIRSSRWCRCLETARLAFGRAEAWPALDSFFDAHERGPAQLTELRHALQQLTPGHRQAWVTHQVVITGLTGLWAASGEVLVLEARAATQPPLLIARFVPVILP